MIYDGFIFYNELELLEIRLHELDPVVDRFIVVESTLTFTGKPKPLVFNENKERFGQFLGKIHHVVVDDMPVTDDPWVREEFQRNAIMRGLQGAKNSDTLIMTDVDEIPRRSTLTAAIRVGAACAINMRSFGGYVDVQTGTWPYARVAPVGVFRQSSPQKVRHTTTAHAVEDAGWHFSSLGGPRRIRDKFDAFSHQEETVQRHNNLATLEAYAKFGFCLFGGRIAPVPIDNTFPAHLVANQARFRHLISDFLPYQSYVDELGGKPGPATRSELEWLYHVAVGYDSALYVGTDPEVARAIRTAIGDRLRHVEAPEGAQTADLVVVEQDLPAEVLDRLTASKVFAGRATEAGLNYAAARFKRFDRVDGLWVVTR